MMIYSRLLILFCAVILGTACMAPASDMGAAPDASDEVAATGNAVASATDGAAEVEDDPLVCEPVIRTGTRVARRTCMRRSQIEAMARGGQEALNEWQRRGLQVGNPTSD